MFESEFNVNNRKAVVFVTITLVVGGVMMWYIFSQNTTLKKVYLSIVNVT